MTEKNGNNKALTETKAGPPQAAVGEHGIEIKTLDTLWWLGNRIIESGLAPKDCKTVSDAVVRMQMGAEIGLHPMQAIQQIANINGRPSVWGDAIPGLVYNSGLCEQLDVAYEGQPNEKGELPDDFACVITGKRRGMGNPQTVRFSVRDAKRAGLWGKDTYKAYPRDMLYRRAMGRMCRLLWPDVLGGLAVAEEVRDAVVDGTARCVDDAPPKSLDDIADRLSGVAPLGSESQDEGIQDYPQDEPETYPEVVAHQEALL